MKATFSVTTAFAAAARSNDMITLKVAVAILPQPKFPNSFRDALFLSLNWATDKRDKNVEDAPERSSDRQRRPSRLVLTLLLFICLGEVKSFRGGVVELANANLANGAVAMLKFRVRAESSFAHSTFSSSYFYQCLPKFNNIAIQNIFCSYIF